MSGQLAPQNSQPQRQELTVADKQAALGRMLEKRQEQLASLLADKQDANRFREIVLTAVSKNPDLLNCSAASMIEACLACAMDGLVPDGKQAALVPFKGTIQYLPMIKGVVECMFRTGFVKDIQCDVVYEGEHFIYERGTSARLEHQPKMGARGKDDQIIGAYAVVTTMTGGVFARAISRQEIDKVKSASRASKGPWYDWYSEMAIKTAIKRVAKILPFSLDVFSRDDAMYDLNKASTTMTRTVALTHNPVDRIEEVPPEPEVVQPEPKQEPVEKAPQKPVQAEVVIEPSDDTQTQEQTSATSVEAPAAVYPVGIIGSAMRSVDKAQKWGDVIKILDYLRDEKTALWDAAKAIGEDNALYDYIKTRPVWTNAFPGDPYYAEVNRIAPVTGDEEPTETQD